MYLENINGPEDVKKLNITDIIVEEISSYDGRGDDRIALCVCIAKGQDCL